MSEPSSMTLERLLAPVQPEQPAGFFDAEDETYLGIDQEMIKLGGLHARTLDWTYVEEAARQYLTQQCKHWRVAGHLLTALLRVPIWAAWSEGIALAAGMAGRYWDLGYPKPGAAGHLAKRKLVATWLTRLAEGVGLLDAASYTPVHHDLARRALDDLHRLALTLQLNEAQLTQIEAALGQRAEHARFPGVAAMRSETPSRSTNGKALSTEFFTPPIPLPLGTERETRRTLLTVADAVIQQDPYDPVGYQLRRFALWAHIAAPPQVRHGDCTELAGVPLDIVEGYHEALAANRVDPTLLQRVERSVASSPFWLQGSFFAARMAEQLAMAGVPDAVQRATQRFAQRLPSLLTLTFSDGRPFADTATQAWITGAGKRGPTPDIGRDSDTLRAELDEQLEREGVEAVLRRLQETRGVMLGPRHRCCATVIAADLLATRGLAWLAEDLYAHVAQQMRTTSAEHWEPAIYNHVNDRVPPCPG